MRTEQMVSIWLEIGVLWQYAPFGSSRATVPGGTSSKGWDDRRVLERVQGSVAELESGGYVTSKPRTSTSHQPPADWVWLAEQGLRTAGSFARPTPDAATRVAPGARHLACSPSQVAGAAERVSPSDQSDVILGKAAGSLGLGRLSGGSPCGSDVVTEPDAVVSDGPACRAVDMRRSSA